MQKEHVKLVVWLRSSPTKKKLGPLDQPFFFPKITNNRVFWLRRRVVRKTMIKLFRGDKGVKTITLSSQPGKHPRH